MPGYPLPEPGRTARMACLLLIVAAVFVVNFTLHQLTTKKNRNRVILNTIISANTALVLTLVLSQVLDSTYAMPSPLMHDTIAFLRNNPSVIIVILFIVNIFAVVSSVVVWGICVGIIKVPGTSTETDTDADR